MTKQNFKLQSVFCAGLVAMIASGCGQKSGNDSPAQGPAAVTPVTQPPVPAQTQPQPPSQIPAQANNGQGSSTNALPQTPAPGPSNQQMPVVPTTYAPQQMGDMFMVNVPQGFHVVYRSSTFDIPGYLKYQYINGGSQRDSAAPYAYNCGLNAQFQSVEPLQTIAGQSLDYCAMTPPISFNSPADPIFNTFRFMTMNTMSYNSIAIASDTSIGVANTPSVGQVPMAKLYVNVFTNVAGVPSHSAFQNAFTNELQQTVSRLDIACAGQKPMYIDTAPIFQGFFSWTVASAPLFGCVTIRGGSSYVEIGAFPIDTNAQILPAASTPWSQWIGQSFAGKRAAEIVVEMGPYPLYGAPSPVMVSRDAQNMMISNIQKLLPSTLSPGNGIIVGPQGPGNGNNRGRGNNGGGFNHQNGTWIPPMNH